MRTFVLSSFYHILILMARVFSNIRSFYETLFPTAAGIGSLSELSEQALFRVASLREAFFIKQDYFPVK